MLQRRCAFSTFKEHVDVCLKVEVFFYGSDFSPDLLLHQ